MDEYDLLVDNLKGSEATIYIFGSYVKGSYIRGASDLDVLIFTEDSMNVLRNILSIDPIKRLRLDVSIYYPGMTGSPRLRAFLATKYGELISGERIELDLSEETVISLSRISASEELRKMFRLICSPIDLKEIIEELSDSLLTIALLYIISRGYYDATKPEIIHYDDVLPKEIMSIVRKAYNVKYAYVTKKVHPIELLKASEYIVKEF